MKCSKCQAYHERDEKSGLCKRHAPNPTIMVKLEGAEYQIVWPLVGKDDGCAESLPRK